MGPRAPSTVRQGKAQHSWSSYSSDSSLTHAEKCLSRDARAFGSMDLHDTFSEHSLPLHACGDVDDEDTCTVSHENYHGTAGASLTSLSQLGAEASHRHVPESGRTGSGGALPERSSTRILERIFSMSSRPSQSPPVLDIPDAANADQGISSAPFMLETPTRAGPALQAHGAGHKQTGTQQQHRSSSMPHAALCHEIRHSCPQIGGPARPSLSSLSLMPPSLATLSFQQSHSGPNFLRPQIPSPLQARPLLSACTAPHIKAHLNSRTSSRSPAPGCGSDADISSSLGSSPARAEAHMPFPVRADSPGLVEPTAGQPGGILSSTSLSSVSGDDTSSPSITDGSSTAFPSKAAVSTPSCVEGHHTCSAGAATAPSIPPSRLAPRPQSHGPMHERSRREATPPPPCGSPEADSSTGVAPAGLFRAARGATAPETPGPGSNGRLACPPCTTDGQSTSSPTWHRMSFRSRLAIGAVALLPDLSVVSTVLLAASGVMGLAYSAAMVHTLILEQHRAFPRHVAFAGLLLVRIAPTHAAPCHHICGACWPHDVAPVTADTKQRVGRCACVIVRNRRNACRLQSCSSSSPAYCNGGWWQELEQFSIISNGWCGQASLRRSPASRTVLPLCWCPPGHTV